MIKANELTNEQRKILKVLDVFSSMFIFIGDIPNADISGVTENEFTINDNWTFEKTEGLWSVFGYYLQDNGRDEPPALERHLCYTQKKEENLLKFISSFIKVLSLAGNNNLCRMIDENGLLCDFEDNSSIFGNQTKDDLPF